MREGEGGGVLIWDGGQGLFNLEKRMVSVLHKELQYKMEKLKHKKVAGHVAKDQSFNWQKSQLLQLVNKPSQISPHEVLQSWLINPVYHLLVKNS